MISLAREKRKIYGFSCEFLDTLLNFCNVMCCHILPPLTNKQNTNTCILFILCSNQFSFLQRSTQTKYSTIDKKVDSLGVHKTEEICLQGLLLIWRFYGKHFDWQLLATCPLNNLDHYHCPGPTQIFESRKFPTSLMSLLNTRSLAVVGSLVA